MSNKEFSVKCHNCDREVNGYTQSIKYVLSSTAAIQESQTIELSCGCVIDFPDWQLNLNTGWCRIVDFTGNIFIEFLDEDLLLEDED
jgi:hypothetical protein